MEKVEVARRELGAGLQLYLEDRCPVAVHLLASAGAEIALGLAESSGKESSIAHIHSAFPEKKLAEVIATMRGPYNALKHFNRQTGRLTNDLETLSLFSDEDNAAILFWGWYDYANVTSRCPPEAQAFELWFLCRQGTWMCDALGVNDKRFRELHLLHYDAAKRELKTICGDYRVDDRLLRDNHTELRPLMFSR